MPLLRASAQAEPSRGQGATCANTFLGGAVRCRACGIGRPFGQSRGRTDQNRCAGFVPALLDRSLLTEVLPIPGLEAIKMARRVMTEDSISRIFHPFSTVVALLLANRPEWKGKRIVTVLPDTGERYLSTQLFKA